MERDDVLALAGRLLLAAIFMASAFGKITNFSGTVEYMQTRGLPWASGLCAGSAALETLAGMALALGFQARWAAGVLGAFLIVATLIFHSAPEQRIQLLKNLAILGGLLEVMAFGGGKLSLENRSLFS